ncbi:MULTISPECIES: heparin lyase I family protein [unclassified Bosea (in: a-proteobacteria)]|uniref:heparin lyase I family protein n=1 Tax=unclassified Bosea (in: a-proteobacteria) TaxID=2653178 RepID=UPI001357671C|nr:MULTISPECIES: heparin lyase I family protein [unclassified Bosea (in: a-proteobacteria)]
MTRRSNAAAAFFCGAILTCSPGQAEAPAPAFQTSFATNCLSSKDWKISGQLDKAVRADRIRCVDGERAGQERPALAITVKPGDAYDPNPGSTPTERSEVQTTAELIRFDATSWYSFRFRVESPWAPRRNRTVIQQIKQNIDLRYEKGRGGEEICDAANPLFKLEVDSDNGKPVFRAKTAGTDSCGDSLGQAQFCGDWHIEPDRWHRVNVMIRPSQQAGESRLRLWLDGRACPEFRGVLGYPRYGTMKDGKPFIDTQPRFGIYRDALPEVSQTILFDDIAFWAQDPAGHPAWDGVAVTRPDQPMVQADR